MRIPTVLVRKEKFNGELWGTYTDFILHESSNEVVLWQPKGTIIRHVERTWTMKYHHLQFFYPHHWYAISARYGYDMRLNQCYCDIILPWQPPTKHSSTVIFVDLELDLVIDSHGKLEIHDEDEFAAAIISMNYPDEIRDGARKAIERLYTHATTWQGPFLKIPMELPRADFHRLDAASHDWRTAKAQLNLA